SQRALNYLERWNRVDDELAALTRVVTLRPVPSHVMVKNHVAVDYTAGTELVPLSFEWKGVDVDADLRPTAPVAAEDDDGARRDFYLLSGLFGSDLESRVLEDDLGIAAVSTLKLLRLAPLAGVPVVEIDSTNVDTALAALTIERDLRDEIASHVHLGRTVTAPQSDVSFLAWTGAGFVSIDPTTGESAYMLSGAIAGGSSATPPGDFDPSIRAALSDPIVESAAPPSVVVAAIEKISRGDLQFGTVGRELDIALSVWVTGESGRPVADNVPIRFRAVEEGSELVSLDGATRGRSIDVPTRDGIASVRLVLGTSTRDNPLFTFEHSADEFSTQVGRYTVAVDEAGGAALSEPFQAFAFPDDEFDGSNRHGRLRLVSGAHAATQMLIVPPEPMWVEVVDRF
ncbi:MAG: hypothetical protein R3344_14430, partial [Acidobacteriota bacterium]|nr:hypothetical protein [Acidobacteriota bacterium]